MSRIRNDRDAHTELRSSHDTEPQAEARRRAAFDRWEDDEREYRAIRCICAVAVAVCTVVLAVVVAYRMGVL